MIASPGLSTLVRRMNLRHFARRRLRALLTFGGVASGVALVFSIAVINATLLETFRSSVKDLAGSAELEVAAADQVGFEPEVIREVAAIDGVERTVPIVRGHARVQSSGSARRILVVGATPEFAGLFPDELLPDVDLDLSNLGGLILAEGVAADLDLGAGDEARIETPDGREKVAIAGIASGGALRAFNGGDVGLMLLPAAQRAFDRGGRIDSIYVVVGDDVAVDEVDKKIEEALGGSAVVGPPGERARGLERVFAGLGTLLSLAGTVALFVALFVVYNTMSISIAERRREISMAMALGATKKDMFASLLAEALVLGTVSAAGGIALGLVLARGLVAQAAASYRVLPVSGGGALAVHPSDIAIACASGIAVALIGAYLPARRVLGVAPVEALRPEASYEWADLRSDRRRSYGSLGWAVGAIALAFGLFILSIFNPENRGIPTLGIVIGMAGVTLLLPRIVPVAVEIVRPPAERGFGTIGRLAMDALAKNRSRTTFTVAALVLTLGVSIGVGGALASYQAQVRRSATALIGAPLYVSADSFTGLTSDQPLPAALGDRLAEIEGVSYVYPLRFSFINLAEDTGVLYAVPVKEALDRGADTDFSQARFTEDPDGFVTGLEAGGVAVSRLTATQDDLEIGDEIELRTPKGERGFEVVAVYEDLLGFDSLYIDYEVYRSIWKDDKADEFGLLLDPGADEQEVMQRVARLLDQTGAPAHVETDDELLAFIDETVEGTFALGRGIQLAALIVAALTIANTMFTAVFERRWEMGLQRAVGMSATQLGGSVLLEAGAIGLIGGIGGAILGTASGFLMLQSMEAQFSWRVPFVFPAGAIVAAVVGGIFVAALAGAIPSRLAMRAPIVESLRYE